MTGYLTGMAVFGAMIRSHIPEEKAGQFQGIRIIGQVLIPGIIGPAAGAAVLRNAEQVINSDGTTSFLPNRNIYMAALVVAVLLLVILRYIFGMMRKGHYRLISQAGEMLLREFQGSNGGALANKDTGLWSRKEGGNDTLPEEDLAMLKYTSKTTSRYKFMLLYQLSVQINLKCFKDVKASIA